MRAPRRRIVLFGRTSDADATTLADILRQETVGGVLMLVAAAVALIWANLGPHGTRRCASGISAHSASSTGRPTAC